MSSARFATDLRCRTGSVSTDIHCGKESLPTIIMHYLIYCPHFLVFYCLICLNKNITRLTYLVECSSGRYYRDDECVKCDFGTYQDETGKSFCKKCPEGTTTQGRESRSVRDCSLFLKDNTKGDIVELTIFIWFSMFFSKEEKKYKITLLCEIHLVKQFYHRTPHRCFCCAVHGHGFRLSVNDNHCHKKTFVSITV